MDVRGLGLCSVVQACAAPPAYARPIAQSFSVKLSGGLSDVLGVRWTPTNGSNGTIASTVAEPVPVGLCAVLWVSVRGEIAELAAGAPSDPEPIGRMRWRLLVDGQPLPGTSWQFVAGRRESQYLVDDGKGEIARGTSGLEILDVLLLPVRMCGGQRLEIELLNTSGTYEGQFTGSVIGWTMPDIDYHGTRDGCC